MSFLTVKLTLILPPKPLASPSYVPSLYLEDVVVSSTFDSLPLFLLILVLIYSM